MTHPAPRCEVPIDSSEAVSVVITTLNRYDECCRCIESVLAQDHPSIDVLVIEDGSASGVEAYVTDKDLPNLRYIRHHQRRGLAAARNAGVRATRGNFIAFADDDDLWKPQRVSRQIAHWRSLTASSAGRVAMVYCGAEVVDALGARVGVLVPLNRGPLKESIIANGLRTIPSSYLFHRVALAAVGGFDESLPSSIDHDIWMSIAVAGYEIDFVADPLVLTVERIGRDTMMSRTNERIQGVTAFASKWRATWQDWYGDGDKHADRYFTRVIAGLAGDQLAQGKIKEAWRASAATIAHSVDPVHCFTRLSASLVRGTARGLRGKSRSWRSKKASDV